MKFNLVLLCDSKSPKRGLNLVCNIQDELKVGCFFGYVRVIRRTVASPEEMLVLIAITEE